MALQTIANALSKNQFIRSLELFDVCSFQPSSIILIHLIYIFFIPQAHFSSGTDIGSALFEAHNVGGRLIGAAAATMNALESLM